MKNVFITADLPKSIGKDLRLLEEFSKVKIVHANTLCLQRTSSVETMKYLQCHGFGLVITKSSSFCYNLSVDSPKVIYLNGNLARPMMKKIILLSTEEITHFLRSKHQLISLGQNTQVIALLESLVQAG